MTLLVGKKLVRGDDLGVWVPPIAVKWRHLTLEVGHNRPRSDFTIGKKIGPGDDLGVRGAPIAVKW